MILRRLYVDNFNLGQKVLIIKFILLFMHFSFNFCTHNSEMDITSNLCTDKMQRKLLTIYQDIDMIFCYECYAHVSLQDEQHMHFDVKKARKCITLVQYELLKNFFCNFFIFLHKRYSCIVKEIIKLHAFSFFVHYGVDNQTKLAYQNNYLAFRQKKNCMNARR